MGRDRGHRVGHVVPKRPDRWPVGAARAGIQGAGQARAQHAGDLRIVVDAILHIAQTGCQWRYLPESLGPWTRVWSQFRRWSRKRHLGEGPDRAARGSPHRGRTDRRDAPRWS
ncbi:MAG: transposase [Motilibacteraceae bacterium]